VKARHVNATDGTGVNLSGGESLIYGPNTPQSESKTGGMQVAPNPSNLEFADHGNPEEVPAKITG
jgi:hypothetical protein